MRTYIIFFTILLFIFPSYIYAIDTKAKQAIVIDYNTNEILFEKNSYEKMIPASMTKIMTVYVAFDRIKNTNLSINDKCQISARAYKMGGSRTFLEIDEQVTIDQLLKGIIIQSGNDASVAIAECLGGTEEDFSKLMNVYAEKLGLKNTFFKNSSGWPEEGHFSTAYDIAILSNALIRDFPNLYSYFSEKDFTYNDINQPNRNKLLQTLDGTDGLKTGFTRKAGWGIAATSKRNQRRITIVISGTNSTRSRMNESSNLINWAFNQTTQKTLLKKNQIVTEVDVWLGNKPTIKLISDKKYISTLSFDQIQLIDTKLIYEKPIKAPIIKGEKYGQLIINIKGKPSIEVSLVAERNIGKINPLFKIFAVVEYLLFGNSLNENS